MFTSFKLVLINNCIIYLQYLSYSANMCNVKLKLIYFKVDKMKNGLFEENGELVYYKSDRPYHAGAISVDGDIYYIGRHGRAVKGEHIVHGEMSNGILKRGTYRFGDDGKLIKGSYIAPKKRKHSFFKKILKNKKDRRILAILSSSIAVILVILLVTTLLPDFNNSADISNQETTQDVRVEIDMPEFESEVLLCTNTVKMLYDGELEISQAISSGINPYQPFVFEYRLDNKDGILQLSESQSFSNPKEFALPSTGNSISIDNLKVDTTYYYKAVVGEETFEGSFKTAKSNRFVYIEGLNNTRDIGGYTTLDGKTVKQGMIIRGRELDGLIETSYHLDNEDVDYVKDEFGFVYDFDLRNDDVFSGSYKSRLGDDVGHKFYCSPAYGAIFNEFNKELLKNIFTDLANEANYPMYMHCTYGADRTGTIVYLLQGILGVPEDKMDMEYGLTGFVVQNFAEIDAMKVVKSNIQNFEGDTINDKIVNFLTTEVGITEQEIQSIRDILLED